MADNISYPAHSFRPNFTDIRSMQIFDPVLTKTTSESEVGTSFEQVHAAGATLENGVRVKCINSSGLRVGIYDAPAGTGTTGDGGFALEDREEVFIEVRQLSHVWVKAPSGTSGYSVIAS